MGSFFSSLFSWFNSSPSSFVIIGKDNAGKTTLYGLLTSNQITSPQPTQHPNSGTGVIASDKVSLIDLGGAEIQRRLWKQYIDGTPNIGIVYMIDISDTNRFEESRNIFLKTVKETHQDIPIVVLLNKTDIATMNVQAVIQDLSRQVMTSNIQFFPCSLIQQKGYMEGLQWLLERLKEKQ